MNSDAGKLESVPEKSMSATGSVASVALPAKAFPDKADVEISKAFPEFRSAWQKKRIKRFGFTFF